MKKLTDKELKEKWKKEKKLYIRSTSEFPIVDLFEGTDMDKLKDKLKKILKPYKSKAYDGVRFSSECSYSYHFIEVQFLKYESFETFKMNYNREFKQKLELLNKAEYILENSVLNSNDQFLQATIYNYLKERLNK